MHRRMAAGLIVALLVLAAPLPSVAPAQSATTCTGWRSELRPPTKIRVLRTYGPAAGKVQAVPFLAYVQNVMAWEWPSSYPLETLKAGAVAIKQFAWYYAMHWRGKSAANGACYDVSDTSVDQIYRPETRSAASSHKLAVSRTWPVSLRKSGRFFLTGYRPGAWVGCGADRDGWRLYQHSARECGRKGWAYEAILRAYYEPYLSVVSPGEHQVAGSSLGDGAVLSPSGEAAVRPALFVAGAGAFAASVVVEVTIAPVALTGAVSADVTGDRRDDLVLLESTDPPRQRLIVLPGTSAGYGEARTWWQTPEGTTGLPVVRDGAPALHLVAGDFDADGRDDAALVVGAEDPAQGRLLLLRSTGSAFAPPVAWYTGALDVRASRAWAADASGDGRADVVLETDLGEAGLRYSVLATWKGGGGVGAPRTWLEWPYQRATTQTVVADVDRDGRADLVVAVPSGDGTLLTALRATTTGSFVRDHQWSSATLAWSRLKLGSADVNGDGRGDVLGYVDMGANGTRILAFIARGPDMTSSLWLAATPLPWATTQPY
ncbi:MAG TPA: FG-GAP-like repeat-containing protein [Candidatus Limnocylindrales bacterium]|nr:FG-GAP-like repeat-containing protein [Candidatus Limnocylindrales bacterium]